MSLVAPFRHHMWKRRDEAIAHGFLKFHFFRPSIRYLCYRIGFIAYYSQHFFSFLSSTIASLLCPALCERRVVGGQLQLPLLLCAL